MLKNDLQHSKESKNFILNPDNVIGSQWITDITMTWNTFGKYASQKSINM